MTISSWTFSPGLDPARAEIAYLKAAVAKRQRLLYDFLVRIHTFSPLFPSSPFHPSDAIRRSSPGSSNYGRGILRSFFSLMIVIQAVNRPRGNVTRRTPSPRWYSAEIYCVYVFHGRTVKYFRARSTEKYFKRERRHDVFVDVKLNLRRLSKRICECKYLFVRAR